LLHHFGTKRELVVAAVEYVFEIRLREFQAAFTALPVAQRNTRSAIDLLWSFMSGSSFSAWLELTVAARTDADLRQALTEMYRRFDPRTTAAYYELFPSRRSDDPTGSATKDFAFALLHGLALDRIFKDDSEIAPVLALLKQLSAALDPAK
jgi:AcrR family transcriptional regulator